MSPRLILPLLLLNLILVGACDETSGARPSHCDPAAATSAAALLAAGDFAVGTLDATYVDGSRSTPAHGGLPELSSRSDVLGLAENFWDWYVV